MTSSTKNQPSRRPQIAVDATDFATKLLALAGEGCPAYVIDSVEVDSHYSDRCETTNGWTGPLLDLNLQPTLERLGIWRGRGFATVVHGWKIIERLPDDLPFSVTVASILIRETVVHEIAHYIDNASRGNELLTTAREALEVDDQQSALPENAARGKFFGDAPDDPKWDGHGDRFIRAYLHLHHRARAAGLSVLDTPTKAAGEFYGLSPLKLYADSLGDELNRMADQPIREIVAKPDDAPLLFRFFWKDDTTPKAQP